MLAKYVLLGNVVAALAATPALGQLQSDYPVPEAAQPIANDSASLPSETLDIVLTYSQGLEAALGIGLRDYIDDEVHRLDSALRRAGRDGGARLVGLRRTNYTDVYATLDEACVDGSGNPIPHSFWNPCPNWYREGALVDLRDGYSGSRGDLSWVNGWRNAAGADLLGLMRFYNSAQAGVCGAAFGPSGANASEVAHVFAVSFDPTGPCAGYPSVLAHEVGHNFGLIHQNDMGGYGRGYQTAGGYRTIMHTYAGPSDRLDFSNASAVFECPAGSGHACGNSGADSARYLVEDEYGVPLHRTLEVGRQVVASVLPSARSISTSGSTQVTFFATLINPLASGSNANYCGVELPGAGSSFTYQLSSGGVPYGTANTEFSITPGGSQELLLSYTPSSSSLSGQALVFEFYCDDRRSAAYTHGVGVAYLTTSPTSSPAPDIILSTAIGTGQQSQNGDLQLNASTGEGEFPASAQNIGAPGTVVIEAMSPAEFLSLTTVNQAYIDEASNLNGATLEVCRTDTCPLSLSSAITASTTSFSGGVTTLRVRVSNASAAISNDPAINRVFLVFTESGTGRLLGATSRAVCTDGTPPANRSTPVC